MRRDFFNIEDVSIEDFTNLLKKNKSYLQMNINVQIRLEPNLTKRDQSIIEVLASSLIHVLTENSSKAPADLDTLLRPWIQTYAMILNYNYINRFYIIFEKAFISLLNNLQNVKTYSYMVFLPLLASKISFLFSSWRNAIETSDDFKSHYSQGLLLDYLALFPFQRIYVTQHQDRNSPVVLGWKRSEQETLQNNSFHPMVHSETASFLEIEEHSLSLKFGETSLYLYPKTPLKKENEETIQNYLMQLHVFASQNAQDEKTLLNKLQILDAFNTVLLNSSGRDDFIKIIKACEELLNYKRCVFYAYIPWSKEFKGVIGEELSKVQKTKGYVYPNQLFHTMIITKKPIFLKDPAPSVKNETIELFNLSSLIVAPICHNEEVLGWMTLDQVGSEFDSTQEDLQLIEEVCNRIGLYLKNFDDHISPSSIELTDREINVLSLLAEGYNNKKIGEFLHLSEHTVRDYISSLMVKLRAQNRTQVVSSGFRLGLLT